MTDLAVRTELRTDLVDRPRRDRSWRIDLANLVVLLVLGLVVGLTGFAVRDSLAGPGGLATSVGALLAMVGTYLTVVLLLLISRLPWLEQAMGHDKMVSWHRKLAPYSLVLIAGHVAFTVLGYAQRSGVDVWSRFVGLVTTYPWMLPAVVAFVLMVSLGVSSYRRVRSRIKYETWATAHLYFYLAVILSFGHQIEGGTLLASNPMLKNAWIALYAVVALGISYGRFWQPVRFSLKHRLRVSDVVVETPGTISVYLSGRQLDKVRAQGGQFFQWRFLTRNWWWQAHPYSLSAAPNGEWLRITVKALGDQSRELATALKVGTRVFAEGPYGVFTAEHRKTNRVVAFAAGVGVTPIRALLEELPQHTRTTVIYRVLSADNAPLAEEMQVIAAQRGWTTHVLAGDPHEHPLTVEHMREFAPDLSRSDIYVCGPAGFTAGVEALAAAAGVPSDRVHHEAFAF